jgi:predicted nucleic acid-binding protein
MTVFFLDTSVLVKRYHWELGSNVVDALFAAHDRRIVISDLSIIELGSALTKKVREGEGHLRSILVRLACSVRIWSPRPCTLKRWGKRTKLLPQPCWSDTASGRIFGHWIACN